MKNIFYSAAAFSILLFSCNKKADESVSAKDSVEVKQTDSTNIATPETHSNTNIITSNEGKYPHEIQIFEDRDFADRLRKITGTEYDEILKNFNVESPIVSEAGIYKFTGCRQHDCPAYLTTILYDAQNDNLNVLIDQEGKITEYSEKGKINYTDALKAK